MIRIKIKSTKRLKEATRYKKETGKKFINPYADVSKYVQDSGTPEYYVTFTKLPKVGINPRSIYNTPVGVYTYPLTPKIYKQMADYSLPFAQDTAKYFSVLKIKDPSRIFFNSENAEATQVIDDERAAEIIKLALETMMGRMPAQKIIQELMDAEDSLHPDADWKERYTSLTQMTEGSQFLRDIVRRTQPLSFLAGDSEDVRADNKIAQVWNVTRELADDNPRTWNKLLRAIGFDGFVDLDDIGMIHAMEPTQAVFLTKAAFQTVKQYKNPKEGITGVAQKHYYDKGNYYIEAPFIGLAGDLVPGRQYFNSSGDLHREDGPAVKSADTTEWYLNGKRHRVDGPAYKDSEGRKWWHLNGHFHRDDGPARTDSDGSQRWYKHGKLHRDDGPAVVESGGDKLWYQNGKRHRVGGPAVEYANGDKLWYQNGEIHADRTPAVEYANGDKLWYQNGELHRVGGPATVRRDGTEGWYSLGLKHRADGPAYINPLAGRIEWYRHGKKHREDGPAVTIFAGDIPEQHPWGAIHRWFLNGNQYSGPTSEYFDSLESDGKTASLQNLEKWKKWQTPYTELALPKSIKDRIDRAVGSSKPPTIEELYYSGAVKVAADRFSKYLGRKTRKALKQEIEMFMDDKSAEVSLKESFKRYLK
jgi:hypothetical protein